MNRNDRRKQVQDKMCKVHGSALHNVKRVQLYSANQTQSNHRKTTWGHAFKQLNTHSWERCRGLHANEAK